MISYIRGDATNPLGSGPKCICHIVNDAGRWGRGFVMALSAKWPETREEYLVWSKTFGLRLGSVLYSTVRSDIEIAHMVAQHGIKTGSKGPPIRYDALEKCLSEVGTKARTEGLSLHMPRIGTGLAQGDWRVIEPILERALSGIPVTVYDQ